jgi:outer membrane protein TolC
VAYQTASAEDAPLPATAQPSAVATHPPAAAAQGGSIDPFDGDADLNLDILVFEVQARNPSLQAMSEAWRAAAERYPQVVSLEDPMFGFMKGLPDGWMVEASQKIPWAGKRALRGNAAAAEADAACQDVQDTRLRLAEAAKMAFFEYFQAQRQLEVNAQTLKLLEDFRQIAQTKYEAGQATQQDVLQADVEIADLGTRTAELERMRDVAMARINTLLHRAADSPLPAAPAKIALAGRLPDVTALQGLAVERRPDLAAIAARARAEEANLCLAYKEYYPDLELVAKYDTFMSEPSMFPQVGMNVNVPLYQQKRHAAVREMSAKLRQRRAEYQNQLDEAAFEVQSAAKRLGEGQRIVELYEGKILPAVQRNIESARINYAANRLDFLRLIEAQRQLRMQQEKYYQSIAEYHRRLAELERAIGGPLP